MKDIKDLESSISLMNSSIDGQMKELQDMMMHLMQPNKSPIPTITTTENGTFVVQDPSIGAPSVVNTMEEVVGGSETAPKIDVNAKESVDSKLYSEVPLMYSLNPPIPHPRINQQGDPPKLTPKAFYLRQTKMKLYLCCSSI
jgi:hypothetical protein